MSDKNIDITINTEADTSGAKEAEKALDDVAKKADEANGVNPMLKGKAEAQAKAADERNLTNARREGAAVNREFTVSENDVEDARERVTEAAKKSFDAEEGGMVGKAKSILQNKDLALTGAKAAGAFAAINIAAQVADKAIGDTLSKLDEMGVDIEKLKQDDPDSFAFFTAVKAIANPLDAVRNAIGAIYQASLNGIIDADSLLRSKIQADDMAAGLDRVKISIEAMQRADTELRLDNLRQASILLKAENDELERNQKIRAADRDLETAQRDLSDKQRLAAGENRETVLAERAEFDAKANIEKLSESVSRLELAIKGEANKVDNARGAEQDAVFDLRQAEAVRQEAVENSRNAKGRELNAERSGGDIEGAAAARRQAEDAFQAADLAYKSAAESLQKARTEAAGAEASLLSATQNLEAEKQANQIRVQTIQTRAQSELESLATAAGSSIEESSRTVLEELQRVAKEQGGELSASARAAMQSLQTILADGLVKPDEIQALSNAAALTKASREAADNAVLSGFQQMTASHQALQRKVDNHIKAFEEYTRYSR